MEPLTERSSTPPASGSGDVDPATGLRELFRLEVLGPGELSPDGAVLDQPWGALAHVGQPSVLNRATCLDFHQPDKTMARMEDFFGALPHTLWLDTADPEPEVDRLLRAHGYVPMPALRGLAKQPLADGLGFPTSYHAELLTDPDMAGDIASVAVFGAGLPNAEHPVFEGIVATILDRGRPWNGAAIYGIRRGDRLGAVGMLLVTGGVAGMTWISTLPQYRHRGMATALMTRGLRDAAALGHRLGISIATPESLRMLAGLGFRTVVRYRVYRQVAP